MEAGVTQPEKTFRALPVSQSLQFNSKSCAFQNLLHWVVFYFWSSGCTKDEESLHSSALQFNFTSFAVFGIYLTICISSFLVFFQMFFIFLECSMTCHKAHIHIYFYFYFLFSFKYGVQTLFQKPLCQMLWISNRFKRNLFI